MGLTFFGLGLRARRSAVPVLYTLGLFVGYVTVVDILWGFWIEDISLWVRPLYYAYNALLVLTVQVLYSHLGERLVRVTVHAVAASVFLQVLLSPFALRGGWLRQPLFFHNENQLGHFAVLAAAIFFLGSKRFSVGVAYKACFYVATVYLALLSVSKSALLGLILLGALTSWRHPLRICKAGLVSALVLLAVLAAPPGTVPDVLQNAEQRLTERHPEESPEERGYDRLMNHPEYLLFGAGEGAYQRFESVLRSELHSTLGTLLFSYGIVGLGLFCYALFLSCRPELKMGAFFLPSLFVGLTHNESKFVFFWVLVAFVCCLAGSAPTPSANRPGPLLDRGREPCPRSRGLTRHHRPATAWSGREET
jgi:hypothetical protein